jgi:hypothetical protein
MKNQRLLVALTVINLGLLAYQVFPAKVRPRSGNRTGAPGPRPGDGR